MAKSLGLESDLTSPFGLILFQTIRCLRAVLCLIGKTHMLSAFHTLLIYNLPHYVHNGEEEYLLTAVDGESSCCKTIGNFLKASGLI